MNKTRIPSPALRATPPSIDSAYLGAVEFDDYGKDDQLNLYEYVRILYSYRALIGTSLLLSVIVALIYCFTVTPLYTATSTLRIGTYQPVLASASIEDRLSLQTTDYRYLDTQIQEITSLSLADSVLKDPTVRAFIQTDGDDVSTKKRRKRSAGGYEASVTLLKRYLGMLTVRPVRKTSLVEIQAIHRNPDAAAQIVNRHAEQYVEWVRDTRVAQQARGLEFLRVQSEDLRAKVADLERELADYAEEHSIVALNKNENIVVQKMSRLNNMLTNATAKRIQAQKLFEEAQANGNEALATFDDESVHQMGAKLGALQAELAELSEKFTPSYPRVRQLKAQIQGLAKSIEQHRKGIIKGLRTRALAAEQEEQQLREELEQQKSQAFELSKRQVQYNVLERELSSSRELLNSVLKQKKEMSLAVESDASNVSIVDLAIPPDSPTVPRRTLLLFISMFVGAGAGIGIAFLLNYLDNTLRTPDEMVQAIRLPSLGVVPSFELEGLGAGSRKLLPGPAELGAPKQEQEAHVPLASQIEKENTVVYFSDPKSLVSEAYRTIRTGILLSQAGEPPRSLLVTSAQSSEGKTTMSCNLAACLSSAGGRVALIDADLRRPSVHRHFNLGQSGPGLVEVLTGQLPLRRVARTDPSGRITIIPSGNIPPNPAELLGAPEMATLLRVLSDEFDYVIVDSPPVLPVTDSVVLARYVDGVVMVVKGGATPKPVVADARDRLQAVGARILGAVLNDVDVRSGDYYYYNRYYYTYPQETEPPGDSAML